MALIEVRGLTKTYGFAPALRKLDLTVERGECVALLGANGSGKSTLIRCLCALSKPTAGTITIGGWSLPREAAAVRAQIGLVAHKPLIYDGLTARENLAFFARLYGVASARIDIVLEQVGLTKRADDPARTYSRGMMQRLSIARAILHEPEVLLLDEPYTGLDADSSAALDALLRTMHADGGTILMALHDFERAARMASRVAILARGQIAYDSATSGAFPRDPAALSAIYAQMSVRA
ncbi:MAG: heme ABC exporter ATP-binding protein CcmA [Chloroflexota bacterium]|nr:heme ABC exporter ATP-binding protein CcmA [Chloroflexota bacterium]